MLKIDFIEKRIGGIAKVEDIKKYNLIEASIRNKAANLSRENLSVDT